MVRQKMIAASALLILVLAATACTPSHASKTQIAEHAAEVAKGEKVKLVEELDDDRYLFSSDERELQFEVWSTADTIIIDGADFGYTGEFTIRDNYEDMVSLCYEAEVLGLMQKYGFDSCERSEQYTAAREFRFCMTREYTSGDIDRVNAFLSELQGIMEREKLYHRDGGYDSISMYSFEVLWQSGESEYIRTSGINTSMYYTELYADGSSIDIRDLTWTDMRQANVIPPVRDGYLIYVP